MEKFVPVTSNFSIAHQEKQCSHTKKNDLAECGNRATNNICRSSWSQILHGSTCSSVTLPWNSVLVHRAAAASKDVVWKEARCCKQLFTCDLLALVLAPLLDKHVSNYSVSEMLAEPNQKKHILLLRNGCVSHSASRVSPVEGLSS